MLVVLYYRTDFRYVKQEKQQQYRPICSFLFIYFSQNKKDHNSEVYELLFGCKHLVYKPYTMCYVIITGRSLAWLLISVAAFMLIVTGIVTPKWLLGQPIITNENNITGFFVPTVGLSNRLVYIYKVLSSFYWFLASFVTHLKK